MNKYPAAMYVRTFTVTAITDPPTNRSSQRTNSTRESGWDL